MILSAEELTKILQTIRDEMRQTAKEEAQGLLDEHLDDYEHTEKKAQVELYQ